jgi:hypothetical protein
MIQRHLFRLGGAIVLAGLLTCAQAVELGDALVRSHIGQPLSADFELTGIVNEAATVQVALADAEVYRGANISMHPALSSLNITIARRDGKRYLHIASPKAVESEYLHIFFALTENGRSSVREATLWFTPDPQPAPPRVAPPAAPAPVPVPAPAVAAGPRPLAATAVAPLALAAPVVAPIVRTAPLARPAACVQQFSAAQIGTCAALDAKNAALTAQIVELENKVRLLTVAMHRQLDPAAAALPAKATQAPPGKPWLFIAIASIGLLALIGVLVYFQRRKRKAPKVARKAVKASTGFMASVRNRLMPAKREAEPPVEPEAGAG